MSIASDVKKMSEIAFSAMLKDLDPHSMFFSSDYYKKINDLNQGKSCGTGVSLFLINDTLTVISVTSGCQAGQSWNKNRRQIAVY